MKNRDLLDILGEIDEELVVDAAPDREGAKPQKIKKKGSSWVKYASLAACCVLILGGVMTSRHFFDDINHPAVVDSGDDTDTEGSAVAVETTGNAQLEATEGKNNGLVDAPVQTEPADILPPVNDMTDGEIDVVLPETEIVMPDAPECVETDEELEYFPSPPMSMDYVFYYYLHGSFSEEYYSAYTFKDVECDAEQIGEKIADTTVEFSIIDVLRYTVKVEIYSVKGVSEDIALCLKFIEEEVNNNVNEHLDFDNYYFLVSESISYESFSRFKEHFLGGEIVNVGYSTSYYEEKARVQYKRYFLGEDAKELLKQLLNQVDGEAVDLANGATIREIEKNCDEYVYYLGIDGCIDGLSSGDIEIYGNGYLYFSSRVDSYMLFYIGKDAAYELIDVIIRMGELQENNTNDSEWEGVNIDVVPTQDYYYILLHENDRHVDRVLYSLRVSQAAFMEEIMKTYRAKYSGVTGASFESAKLVSDKIVSLPLIVPKENVEVSSISMSYYADYDSFRISYMIDGVSYAFLYKLLPLGFNDYGATTKQGVATFSGISFDVYGNSTFHVANFLCPGHEDKYIKIEVSDKGGKLTGIPNFDMFEFITLTPSSREDIAKLYEEEPVYDEPDETMVFEIIEKE